MSIPPQNSSSPNEVRISKKVCFKQCQTVERYNGNGFKKRLRSLDSNGSTIHFDVAPKERGGRLQKIKRKWETESKSTVFEEIEGDQDEDAVEEEFEVEAILDHSKVKHSIEALECKVHGLGEQPSCCYHKITST